MSPTHITSSARADPLISSRDTPFLLSIFKLMMASSGSNKLVSQEAIYLSSDSESSNKTACKTSLSPPRMKRAPLSPLNTNNLQRGESNDGKLHGRGVSSGSSNVKYELHGRGVSSCARLSSRSFADFGIDEVDNLDGTTGDELNDHGNDKDAMDDDDATDDDNEHAKKEDVALLEDASEGGGDKGIYFRPDQPNLQLTAAHVDRMAARESKRIAAEGRLKATHENAEKYQAESNRLFQEASLPMKIST